MVKTLNTSKREVLGKIKSEIEESGLFTKEGIKRYMAMISGDDELMDVELSTMFLIRDGMQRHSYDVVRGFIRRLPLNMIQSA